ncbi:MAG: lipoyl synthase [Bacteroidales bacterium]|nr:lipoyl synthase [Bacteroidales bacterium]
MEKKVRKPSWLKIDISSNDRYSETKKIVDTHCLHTICTSGRCPNLGECWGKGTATFLIGGDICTRNCKFCNTKSGKPLPLNEEEPNNIAKSIRLMRIKHAVITSVDRDDLPDYGANHWVKTIEAIKKETPQTTLEVLIPDFQGDEECIDSILKAQPHIISHNMETVKRITPIVRSVATYETSLKVIEQIASSGLPAKSGIMVGLGETPEEVESLMDDLLNAGCSILTLGQYLQPSKRHYPVFDYITPDQFTQYKERALQKGFKSVESGPLVRSSYHAERHISIIK